MNKQEMIKAMATTMGGVRHGVTGWQLAEGPRHDLAEALYTKGYRLPGEQTDES